MSFFNAARQVPGHHHQQVRLANILSFLFCWVSLAIAVIFFYLFGNISSLPYIYGVAALFLIVPLINRWDHRLGRIAFCLIPVVLTMFVTIHFKLHDSYYTSIVYFDSRFILMVTHVLPGLIFRLEERSELLVCLGASAISIMF